MELKDGLTVKLGNTQVKIVEKLGDRAKFNSATNIEVRLAEVPTEEKAQSEYLEKCVLWATTYYQKVDEAKKSGEKLNPRQIKKDCFAAIFGNVEPVKTPRPVTVVKAEPKAVSKPVTQMPSVKLDPAELSKQFDTFKADDLLDSADKGGEELPPLLEDEDDLLGAAHVAGEEVLQQLGGSVPDISSLGGDDFFND